MLQSQLKLWQVPNSMSATCFTMENCNTTSASETSTHVVPDHRKEVSSSETHDEMKNETKGIISTLLVNTCDSVNELILVSAKEADSDNHKK